MQARLIKEYKGAARNIQVMPVDEDEGLPLPEIYGSVLVEEDLTAIKTPRPYEPSGSKTLDSIRELFFVQDKLAKRIILQGEAGYGKTVFCLKALDCWSNVKLLSRGAEGKIGKGSVETRHVGEHTDGTQGSESDRGSGKRLIATAKPNKNAFLSFLKDENDEEENDDGDKEDKELLRCLSLFDLVFYVPLRHAKHGTFSTVDLVCNSIPECDEDTEQKIKQMLRGDSITCLVILDGLDEWRAPDTCRVRGFPDSDGLVNCTLLCTMRPWRMVSLQLRLDSTCDKVVQILGLKNDSIEIVISNVLVNFYGLEISSDSYKEKFSRFCGKARIPEMNSLMKIPLMLTASCLVWNEEDDMFKERQINKATSYFMTFFYLKLMEITITRADNKHDIVKFFLVDKRQNPDVSLNVPNILLGFEPIIDFIEILKPVGRLALQDLVSDEPHLVFPRNKLEREIGQSKVELALKAGILSQSKAPGLSYQQMVSVSFYHKSIQEFNAALYMTCGGTEALKSFRSHCNTVEKVMELSNIIKFVFGLDPIVGCVLSEHVKDVVNSDANIIQYRESLNTGGNVSMLYKMHIEWFGEMLLNLPYTHNTDCKPCLHVTDVYLSWNNRDEVSVASELVSMEDNSIVSVCLKNVDHPVHSIIQQLPGCNHLTTLYIRDITNTRDKELLAVVLPLLIHLQCVQYGYDATSPNIGEKCNPADTAVVRALQHLPALRYIELWDITLTDTVTLPPQLKTVKLYLVEPAHFILPSLCLCSQSKFMDLRNITLTDTVVLPSQLQEVKLVCVRSSHFILLSLLGCRHLASLHIAFSNLTMEDCEVLASVLPQLLHLQYIHYEGGIQSHRRYPGHATVIRALQHIPQLRHIKISNVDMYDADALLITPTTQLQEVDLDSVKMSVKRWTEFVSSLVSIHHTVHVTLCDTNIVADTIKTIRNSPHFTVTTEFRNCYEDVIQFHTVQ